MNKERKVTGTVLHGIMIQAAAEGGVSHRMSRVLERAVETLISAEERALRAMEPYRENASTVANYTRSEDCLENLQGVLEHLVDGELEDAADLMLLAIEEPAPAKPAKKTKRRKATS